MAFTPSLDTANVLIGLDEALAYCGIADDDAEKTNMITQCINGASSFCNSNTKRKLKSRELVEYYNGDGTNTIMLNNYPATTLTSVYDDIDRAYGADTLIDPSNLVVMPTDLLYCVKYDGGYFLKGLKNLKVTYTAGLLAIPYDLQQACLGLVMLYMMHTTERKLGIVSRSIGDGSVTIESSKIPDWIMETLNAYRKKW